MNVRAAAAEVIARVLRGQSLSALLPEYSDRVEEKDRPLLKEMCFGTMRWYPQIAILLKQLLAKPLREKDLEVQGLLACGLYQLMHMRIAEHAILNETVSATTKLNPDAARALPTQQPPNPMTGSRNAPFVRQQHASRQRSRERHHTEERANWRVR